MVNKVTAWTFGVRTIYSSAILLRMVLLLYGLVQDAYSPIKYTDIDYFVFTDAARYVSRGQSPYLRDTYRYTPLLAWLLLPCAWNSWWFHFGKVVFSIGDIVAGWFIMRTLQISSGMSHDRALKFASLWLLNPMVATISTRGSSEGLLGVIITSLLWAVVGRRTKLAGALLGLAVHFKIYPFIYGASIMLWLEEEKAPGPPAPANARRDTSFPIRTLSSFINPAQISFALASIVTFLTLNGIMLAMYGWPFLQHTYFHHITRLDHRHNFSVYNVLLYLNSSPVGSSKLHLESLAFIPQLLLSAVLIPLALAKLDIASTMLAQTFAFVTFNKVCTSQYFLWYLVLLPFYLPKSSFLSRPRLGILASSLWVLTQAMWLQQGYQLEFLGKSTFVPGLWMTSISFFVTNVWVLGVISSDIRRNGKATSGTPGQPVVDA